MARKLEFVFRGNSFHCAIEKVDRTKLYGSVEVLTRDTEGLPCALATLAGDGRTLIPYGGTAFGYVNEEGLWVDRGDLIAVDTDGEALQEVESSFNRATELSWKVSPEEFLDYSIRLCYSLASDEFDPGFLKELKNGSIFRVTFSYRGGVDPDAAFVLQGADEEIWLLVGAENEFEMLGLDQVGGGLAEEDDAEDGDSDGFDFEMM